MPTYEYSCTECGERLEVVQSIHDDALAECPNCGGKLRKLFGNVGVVFKGSGFYKTDSRKSGSGAKSDTKAAASGTSTASETSTGTTSTKSDSSGSSSPTSKPAASTSD